MTIVYRFRPMDSLLDDYHELEEQELALSSPRHFNDPLEGYQDVFWEGDQVLWENLLRNYLLNLLSSTHTCLIWDDDEFDEFAIQADLTPEDLPTDEFRQLFESVCEAFFDERGFQSIPAKLAALPQPLKRKGLQLVLSGIHPSALQAVSETLQDAKIISDPLEVGDTKDADPIVKMLDGLSAAMTAQPETEWIESLASLVNPLKSHAILQREVQRGIDDLQLHSKKEIFLRTSFPGQYIREIITSLIHTDWHTLCFAKECTNPPMWATYADEHRGAALMFRVDDQTDDSWGELTVTGRTGWHGSEPKYDEITATLYDIDYESPPPEVDFFRSLGTLPLPKLRSAWHSTPDGETSQVVGDILEDHDAWIDNHWDQFHNMTTRKLGQWEHEQEVRMVLPDLLGSEGSHKKVTYDMSQLEGVVFGLRTKLEDRFEVMRILSGNGRDGVSSSVDFYKMVFDGSEFKKMKLGL